MTALPLPHIILVSIDSLRADALSGLAPANHAAATPNLDRILSQGTAFRNCLSSSPVTTPSHASMFTGQYPDRHGLQVFLKDQLPHNRRSLFTQLRAMGYQSLASVDFQELFISANLLNGCTLLKQPFGELSGLEHLRALNRKKTPGLLFVHFGDVHFPYGFPKQSISHPKLQNQHARAQSRLLRGQLPSLRTSLKLQSDSQMSCAVYRGISDPRRREQRVRQDYLDGISHFDRTRFGTFLTQLDQSGLLANSILIITSDHGEELTCSRLTGAPKGHAGGWRPEVFQVPLLFYSTRLKIPAQIIEDPVSHVDLLPTLLSFINSSKGMACDGLNLKKSILSGWASSPPPNRVLYSESFEFSASFWKQANRYLRFLETDFTATELKAVFESAPITKKKIYWTDTHQWRIRETNRKWHTTRFRRTPNQAAQLAAQRRTIHEFIESRNFAKSRQTPRTQPVKNLMSHLSDLGYGSSL